MAVAEVRYPTAYLFGDSQTQMGYDSWIPYLADGFQRRCDFINRGFSGYNTRWCKIVMGRLFNKDNLSNCRVFTVLLGSNDANQLEINPLQHVPLAEYASNIKAIVQYLERESLDKSALILISPPPVNVPLWSKCLKEMSNMETGLDNNITGKYAKACVETAESLGVTSVDLYSEMMKSQNWHEFVKNDGLHLSREGGKFLANLLAPEVEKRLEGSAEILPNWSTVDRVNPVKSLL